MTMQWWAETNKTKRPGEFGVGGLKKLKKSDTSDFSLLSIKDIKQGLISTSFHNALGDGQGCQRS